MHLDFALVWRASNVEVQVFMHVALEADSPNSLFCSTSQSLYQKLIPSIQIKMQLKHKDDRMSYTQETNYTKKTCVHLCTS